jgi:hypothetical protein
MKDNYPQIRIDERLHRLIKSDSIRRGLTMSNLANQLLFLYLIENNVISNKEIKGFKKFFGFYGSVKMIVKISKEVRQKLNSINHNDYIVYVSLLSKKIADLIDGEPI